MKNKLTELKKQIRELKDNAEKALESKKEEEFSQTLLVGRYFAYDKVLKLIAEMEEKENENHTH